MASTEDTPLLAHSSARTRLTHVRNAKSLSSPLHIVVILLLILEISSFLFFALQTFGDKFWAFQWTVPHKAMSSPPVRFWTLPFVGLALKDTLLLICVCMLRANGSMPANSRRCKVFGIRCMRYCAYGWCLGFLALIAFDSFQLDASFLHMTKSRNNDLHFLAHAKTAYSLLLVVTVLELVTFYYHPGPSYLTMKEEITKSSELPTRAVMPRSGDFAYKKMLCILRPYFWPKGAANRIRACSTYIFLVLSKVANLVSPLFMARATNFIVERKAKEAIIDLTIFCALSLTSKLFKELQSLIYLKVKQTAYIELATTTYAHMHSLSYGWHVEKKLGDVLRSMDRGLESANSVVSYVFLSLVPTLAESVVVLIIFASHFQSAGLSFIVFISLVVYTYLTIKITLWRKKFREATRVHDNEYHDKATDALMNYETIKYFTNEKFEIDSYSSVIKKFQSKSVTVQASLSLLNSSQALIFQATILAALAVSVPYVIHHEEAQEKGMKDHIPLDIGGFVAISVYLNNLFQPLAFLGTIYNMIIRALVDMEKLGELLSLEPEIRDQPCALELQIGEESKLRGIPVQFQHVCFQYPRYKMKTYDTGMNASVNGRGVRNLTFDIKAGTTTALVGETGSGKSTVGRLLFRFYDPDKGTIYVDGHDIKSAKQDSLRKLIGIVPQDTILFNDSIYFNIAYGDLKASHEQVVQAAKQAKIYDFIMKLPDTWETKVGERGLKLSGGEKQRIAIARVLLKDPPLVILDEATSALDTITENEIQLALRKLKNNRTMLIIAHRLSTVRHADQILVLCEGEIVESGSHDELSAVEGGVYTRLWKAQMQRSNEDGE